MNTLYNVGDIIEIHSWEYMAEKYQVEGDGIALPDYFAEGMEVFCKKRAVIISTMPAKERRWNGQTVVIQRLILNFGDKLLNHRSKTYNFNNWMVQYDKGKRPEEIKEMRPKIKKMIGAVSISFDKKEIL